MGSETPGGDLTVEGYWGQLRGWGFGNPRRVTPGTFTMLGLDQQVANVPCPENMTPEQRMASLQMIAKIHLGTAN